jgi:hypothetical protein
MGQFATANALPRRAPRGALFWMAPLLKYNKVTQLRIIMEFW